MIDNVFRILLIFVIVLLVFAAFGLGEERQKVQTIQTPTDQVVEMVVTGFDPFYGVQYYRKVTVLIGPPEGIDYTYVPPVGWRNLSIRIEADAAEGAFCDPQSVVHPEEGLFVHRTNYCEEENR